MIVSPPEKALFLIIDADIGLCVGYTSVPVDYVVSLHEVPKPQPEPLIIQHEVEVLGNKTLENMPFSTSPDSVPDDWGFWTFTLNEVSHHRDWESGIVDEVEWHGTWFRSTWNDFDELGVDYPIEERTE